MATLGFAARLALTGVALAAFAALLLAVLRPSTRTARRLLLVESALAGLIDHLDQVEQTLVNVSLQSSQIRERLGLLERRLDELEQAHSDQQSALREAREHQQQRLQDLRQTITAHKHDLAALTNTLAPTNGRPDLHLVPAVESHAEVR